MTRKPLPFLALTALLVTLLVPVLSAAERNILFIITDDQSPTLGCYGDPVASSPHVDRLARDGTLFTHAYATTASCSASRSVVMSGLHNHRNGQFGHAHSYHKFESFRDVISLSLPRALERAGYRTAQAGKYHVAPEEVFRFQHYLGSDGRNPVALAESCREFIQARDDRPFFLYYATSDPHRSGDVDKTSPLAFKPNLFGNPAAGESRPGVTEVVFDPAKVPVPPFLPDTPEARAELAHYYQSCARVDQGVGRLLQMLEESGLLDKTLIVFTADHGMAFPGGKTTVYEAGLRVPFVVRDPYQEVRGVKSSARISHTDITPSLLDFAGALDRANNAPRFPLDADAYWKGRPDLARDNRGVDPFRSYHGKSWLPILGQPAAVHHEFIFASHTFHEIQMYYPMRSLFDGRYKLIWNIAHGLPYPFASDLWAASTWQAQLQQGPDTPYGLMTVDAYIHRPAFELYDLSLSPFEQTNLAGDPHYVEVLEGLKRRLRQFQESTGDPWILKWEYE